MTTKGLAEAIEVFDRVVALDPDFLLCKRRRLCSRVRLSLGEGEPADREIAIRLAREVATSGIDDPRLFAVSRMCWATTPRPMRKHSGLSAGR
jgi:hypothetical protein